MTLTEFLLARIAEDEREAREADAVPAPSGMWDDDRVLAECAAKRQIVAQWDACQPPASGADHLVEQELELVLMHLALPYADHPDYDPSWRP